MVILIKKVFNECMVEILRPGGMSPTEVVQAPLEIDPSTILTKEQAEMRVRQIRNGFWVEFRPGDRMVANAHARMAVADEAFGLLSREDITPQQRARVAYLLIEARDKIVRSTYGHFGRAPDLWADQISFKIREINAAREITRINE